MDQYGIPVFIFIITVIAGALVVIRVRRILQQAAANPRRGYVWLRVIGTTLDESTQDTYRSAYLLLMENVRMELRIADWQAPIYYDSTAFSHRSSDLIPRSRSRGRTLYTTESLEPHLPEIRSFEDFQRHATYAGAWLTEMRLSVHPEDADKAVQVLEHAGLTVEKRTGTHFWH